jgi:peroxiredoxin
LREFDQEIAELQGRVAVISFASADHLKRFAERFGHPYLWLADPKRLSYKRLGLGRRGLFAIAPPRAIWGYIRFALRGKMWHPEQLDMSQMGGDFVFDRDGNLTLRHVSSRSDDRPSMNTVMSAFRRAASMPTSAAER